MRERDLKSLEFDKVMTLVMGMAASEPAREVLARVRPAGDADTVRDRLRATAEMAELRQHTGSIPIQEFSDLRTLFLAAAREGAILDGESLVKIRDFVLSSRHVASFIRSRVEPFPHVAVIAANLLAPKELADALLKALADDGQLLDDASPALKRLRNRLREERVDLEARLLRSLNQPGMEAFVSDHLVTLRNHRFVLPLKLNYTEKLAGIVQDRSVSGETLFVEPMWAVELNNRLMMLESEVEAEEHRILMQLSAMVRGYSNELHLTFDAMVSLDALNARAIFAERFECSEPQISAGEIELLEARHPLLTVAVHDVVPIDLRIPADHKGIVISGPNTGGKTVALKTLGLLALMAQAGLLIPARAGSKVAVFRSVFADIGDEQSIETSLSTFSAHIANLSDIVRSLEEPALVILDEPGAGTDPAEGAALAIGLINHLAARRCLVAVATHSTAVKLHAYSRSDFEVAAVDFDPERLVPLYRLKPHTIGQSYGLVVARRLGLAEEIIKGAQAAMGESTVELETAIERLEQQRANLEAEITRASEHSAELAERQREAAAAEERARERFERERKRLRDEVTSLMADFRREGDELLREIRSGAKSRHDLSQFQARAAERLERAAPIPHDQETESDQAPLKVGDQVELGGIRGELVVMEPGKAVVSRGGLRIEVSPERLRRAKAESVAADARERRATPSVTVSSSASEREELNLIGMRTSEALRKLEEFLDQAYLTNRKEVRIIHGIGSGALRKAVLEYLATSPYSSGYHEAEPHHGGAGATVVELNL
jgi:DNA mismatch repair protein MutS2